MTKQKIKVDFSKPIPGGARSTNKFTDAVGALVDAPVGASVFVEHRAPHHGVAYAAINAVGPKGWATTRRVTEDGVSGIRIWKLAPVPAVKGRK